MNNKTVSYGAYLSVLLALVHYDFHTVHTKEIGIASTPSLSALLCLDLMVEVLFRTIYHLTSQHVT